MSLIAAASLREGGFRQHVASKAGTTRPSSSTRSHLDRVAPLEPPPLWTKIFSSDASSSAANSTVQIFATESGQKRPPLPTSRRGPLHTKAHKQGRVGTSKTRPCT